MPSRPRANASRPKHTSASQRAKRLSDVIQRELSMHFFQAHLQQGNLGPTITAVDVASDLGLATIWVTQLEGDAQELENRLNEQAAYWRKLIAPALSNIHSLPKVRFRYDKSLEKNLRIQSLISEAMSRSASSSDHLEEEHSAPLSDTLPSHE